MAMIFFITILQNGSIDSEAIELSLSMGAHDVGLRTAAGGMRRIPRPIAAAIAVRDTDLDGGPDAIAPYGLATRTRCVAGTIAASVIGTRARIGAAFRPRTGDDL